MKYRLLIASLFAPFLSTAQDAPTVQPTLPIEYGLETHTINDSALGPISFYIDTVNIRNKAPLFLDVNGAGGLPLCLFIQGKDFASTYNTFKKSISEKSRDQYHYVILDKPGTPFCDTVTTDQDRSAANINALVQGYPFSPAYNRRLSLQWRVEATRKVVDYLVDNGYWDSTRILAYGYSEGGQVVPSLAVADKRITHIAMVEGSGLGQFYEGILGWRMKSLRGKLTPQQAQDGINKDMATVRDVFQNPTATDKFIGGHTYLRWASFGANPVFEQLRKLTIPVYMVAGTDNDNTPVFGLDYILLDNTREGKTNLTYDPCVGCNSSLVTRSTGENDKPVNHSDEYLQKILNWSAGIVPVTAAPATDSTHAAPAPAPAAPAGGEAEKQ